MSSSMSTRSLPRKARIGYGATAYRCRGRMTGPSFTSHAAARTRLAPREFDLTTRQFVADGFNLPEARSHVDWLDRDTLLLMLALGPNMATRTGLPRTVRLWRRGTDPAQAPVLFETKEDYSAIWAYVDRDAPEQRIWFFEKPGLIDVNSWIGDRTGPKIKIELPADAAPDEFRGGLP